MSDKLDQFNIGKNMTFDVTIDELHDVAHQLEQAEAAEPEGYEDKVLSELVTALKRVENAAEDARKDVFEPELEERVDVGDRIGPLVRQSGRSTWVEDTEGAFAAVAEAGEDPMSVADVSISDLRDVLGDEAENYIGESEYTYFKRES